MPNPHGPVTSRPRQSKTSQAPILLVEDSNVGNATPTEKGTILRRIHEELKAEGITDLHFLSNRNMLGTDGDGTVDGCHPNDIGMMRQATVFSKSLSTILGMPTP